MSPLILVTANLRKIGFAMIFVAAAQVTVYGAEDHYPSRPVHVILPFSPGGSTDILVRPIAAKLQDMLGQPFVIENRGGAGGNIGAAAVAFAKPDGYTLMMTTSGVVVVNKSLYSNLSFDPENDFVPISIIASLPNVLVVAKKSPFNSVGDIVRAAKAEPGHLTFGSGGIGTSNHLSGELLKYIEKIDITHIPYRGGGPAVIAALSGETSMLFATMPSAIGQVRAGQLKALAVTSRQRAAALPDVPTMAEAGVQDFAVEIWIGALAPKGTPLEITEKLSKAIAEVLKDPDIRKRLEAEGYNPVASTPADMSKQIQTESALWKKVIGAAGLHAQ
jgi:tripartite-type tricarboxylate transporter receptor subunit TctC